MTNLQPEYLFPLSSAIKWQNQITLESLAESYNNFVLAAGADHLNQKNSSRTPEERIISYLQTKQITVPDQVTVGNPAVAIFLSDYRDALDLVWDVSNVKNKKFLTMVDREYSFQAPKKPNGKDISEDELMVLEHFELPRTHDLKMDKEHPKKFDITHFANQLPSHYSLNERRVASYYLDSLMDSALVETKYKGSSEKRVFRVFFAVVMILSTILVSMTTTSAFTYDATLPLNQKIITAIISGVCGIVFSSFIGIFVTAIIASVIDHWNPQSRLMPEGDYHVYKISLTPQGEQLLREGKAWRNYMNTRLEKNSKEKPVVTKDIYRSKTGTFIRIPIQQPRKRKLFKLNR